MTLPGLTKQSANLATGMTLLPFQGSVDAFTGFTELEMPPRKGP